MPRDQKQDRVLMGKEPMMVYRAEWDGVLQPTGGRDLHPQVEVQTFQSMAVETANAYMLSLDLFEKQNDRPANAEESLAMLMGILEKTFEAVFEGAMKLGVATGGALGGMDLREIEKLSETKS